jgi:hypothetical protein
MDVTSIRFIMNEIFNKLKKVTTQYFYDFICENKK